MEKDFKKYDEICATAINWLIWNQKQNLDKNLCITNITSIDAEDLWLLTIANSTSSLLPKKIFISINILDFLYLRFVKKLKYLQLKLSNKNKYFIDSIIFKQELADSCKEDINIFAQIYDEYYRR